MMDGSAGASTLVAMLARIPKNDDSSPVAGAHAMRARLVPAALCAWIAGAALAGCGGAKIGAATARHAAKPTDPPAKQSAAAKQSAPAKQRSVVARIDVSSDRILAEGKVHIAAGAPSDAEIKREIAAARKAGITLPSGETAASFENATGATSGPAAGARTPETPWNPRLKPIAAWIIPILQWASEHGWRGAVTSGFRTFYEQAQLNAAGAFSASAGLSNHETTTYPGGAVDVTLPGQLLTALRGYPGSPKLVGGVLGPVDPEHFSATGD